MRRIILLSVICVLLAVSLPAAAGPLRQRPADGGAPPAAPPADGRTLTILKDGQVLTLSLEEYLPGVIAAMTPLPVIGVPVKSSLEGMDAALAMLQMPPGIPVATVAINGAQNAAILAMQIMANGDPELFEKVIAHKQGLKQKIVKANDELANLQGYRYKV